MNTAVIEAQYPIEFRKKEAEKLGEHLKHRQSVNIVGLKRVGISNFLRFFLYHKDIIGTYINDNNNHIFIPVDLNDLIELEIYPFWTLTLKRIVDEVEKSQLPEESKKKINSLFLNSIQSQDLFLLIDSVRQALMLLVAGGLMPTLFFIRFDRIAHVFTPSFFDNLQGLRDATHHQLTYVFTSYRSLSALFPSAKTAISVFAQFIYMPPALENDMCIIYNTYKKQFNLQLDPEMEKELFRIVDGNVQYLQLALIVINETKPQNISSVEDLFKVLTGDERINLQSEELWDSLTRDEQKILIKIIKNEAISPEEREKSAYLWDTGFVKEYGGEGKIFSPLVAKFLEGISFEEEKNDLSIHLTKKEHLLFTHLKSHIGNICEREEIIETVWPEYRELGISDWAIDRLVARVRAKLKQQNSPYEIVTVRTRGYKLSAIKR